MFIASTPWKSIPLGANRGAAGLEQAFGWLKTITLFRKLRHRGGRLVDWLFSFGAAAYNLVRWRNLVAQRP